MRNSETERLVLPALRLVLAIAASLDEARALLAARLPDGWSCEAMETPDCAAGLVVMPEDGEGAPSFVVSEAQGEIRLDVLWGDRLEELGRGTRDAAITLLPRLGRLGWAA